MSFSSSQATSASELLKPYKEVLWYWYIFENKTIAITRQTLQQHYPEVHALAFTETFPSLRTLERTFQAWGFWKNGVIGNNSQLCQRVWVLFYDMNLTDVEILRFLEKEGYLISLKM